MFFCSDVSVKYDEANVTAEFRFHGDKEYTVEMRTVEGALYYTLSWPPHAGLLTKVFWFCCSTMQLFCLICTVRVWILQVQFEFGYLQVQHICSRLCTLCVF